MVKDNTLKNNKPKYKENTNEILALPTLNVGMVGHIDHGKTTLLYKLSGKFADQHSEELKRGITIKLGYADIIVRKDSNGVYNAKEGKPERYITFVDAPGHEMLMATMLSGATMMDAAILVIAANEGIKPQTKEHFVALQAKNIKNLIIVQNKIDLVSKEKALENYKQIKEFVKGTFAENSPIIPVSAQQDINIDKILMELCNIKIPERDTESEPLFVVARSFDINRPGTNFKEMRGGVLGGILKRGILSVGDEIEIKPGLNTKKGNQLVYETIKTKIVSINKGSINISEGTPGGSLALETELDPSLTKADSLSGCVASLVGKLPELQSKIKVNYSLFQDILGIKEEKHTEGIKINELLMISINTSVSVGRVIKAKAEKNKNGKGEMELELRIPIVAFKNDNIGIARNIDSHWRLIGFGEIA